MGAETEFGGRDGMMIDPDNATPHQQIMMIYSADPADPRAEAVNDPERVGRAPQPIPSDVAPATGSERQWTP